MKYIRTKCKIYECAPFEELDEQDKKIIENNSYSGLYDYQNEDVFVKVSWEVKPFYKIQPIKLFNVIKSADTIEELCDELVEYGNRPVVISQTKVIHGRMSGKTPTILGAIWTDKGLIYVAKMNDKGELELL